MNNRKTPLHFISVSILICFISSAFAQKTVTVDDRAGVLGETGAPVIIKAAGNYSQVSTLIETSADGLKNEIPVQLRKNAKGSEWILMMPAGKPGIRKFKPTRKTAPAAPVMTAEENAADGQVIIRESGKRVLQYNYRTVYEPDVVRAEGKRNVPMAYSKVEGAYYDEYLKAHPKLTKDAAATSSIYAVPRSDYIHPIYGLNGEMLTCDWPDGGHPHHRGIFWAWPEVEYKSERGDIYALLRVFARPTGNISYTNGAVFAEIEAENIWMWENEKPIVREQVTITAYRASQNSRVIDLTVTFQAIEDEVTVATRFTNSYGGLNVRMETPAKQQISYYTDPADASPLRAWANFNGKFENNQSESGMTILQHPSNPEYPGAWVQYPNLSWVQPTFPTPGTRYPLSKDKTLTLKYRFVIHQGNTPDNDISAKRWDAFQSTNF
ncbi:MAG: PmoA family protein [Prevotellaceae bacterium]|jgi:hypothetical protein|nr:PmoA family protein [Prevotellaceae bacterium]